MRLRTRLVLYNSAVIAGVVTAATLVVATVQARVLEAEIEKRGVALARGLASLAVESLLVNDWVELRQQALGLARTEDVESAAIADRSGRVVVDTAERDSDLGPRGLLPVVDSTAVATAPRTPTGARAIEILEPVVLGRSVDAEDRLGTVRLRIGLERIDLETRRLQGRLLGIGAVAVGGGFLAATLFTRRISRPVENLVAGTIKAASGDLRFRVEAKTGDELGTLAENFNRMTTQILAERETIEALNRGLEAQVLERTAELQKANDDLTTTLVDLRRTQGQLVQSEKMASLGQLVAGVIHELNNPLNFIANSVQPLTKNIADLKEALRAAPPAAAPADALAKRFDRVEGLAGVIREGARRATLIVGDLRTFCRPDEAERKVGDLREGIESTVHLLAPRLGDRIEVVREHGEVPPFEFFPAQMNQVVMNLVANAADAISGRGTIGIRTRVEGESVVLQVSDTGAGIAPETLPKIFEPFFTTKEVGKGMGLGLSITYSIVKKHGGTIDVATEVGRGTTFTVRVPLVGARGTTAS